MRLRDPFVRLAMRAADSDRLPDPLLRAGVRAVVGHRASELARGGPQAWAAREGVFTLEAGTFVVLCTIPGHREAGMVGTITAG